MPPIVGLANNGDFSRIAEPLGIFPEGAPEDLYFRWVVPRYRFDASKIWLGGLCCYSSQTILGGIALPVGLLISPPGSFDIQAMGVVNAVAFLAAAGVLVLALRPLHPALRALGAFLVFLLFTDVAYVAFFNSFYTEPAAFAFLLSAVGLALLLAQRIDPPGTLLAAYFATVALLATSRPQNAMLGVLFALLGVRLAGPTANRSRRRFAVAAAVAVALLSFAYSRQMPPLLRRIYLYNAVFRELLPKSPTPRQDLIALGLDPALERLVETSGFARGVPIGEPEFEKEFFDRIGYGSLARFYAARPARLRIALDRAVSGAFQARSLHGNFPKSAGRAPGARSGSFATWSGAKARFLPARLWFVIAFVLLNLAAAVALLLRGRTSAARRSAEVWMGVALVAGYQFALSSVMDAGSRRALLVFHASFDLMCAALILLAVDGVLALGRKRAEGLSRRREATA